MNISRIHRSTLECLGFGAFAVLYHTPLLLDAPSMDLNDPRVRVLFEEALSENAVRIELLRNLVGHLLPLFFLYLLLAWGGSRFARAIGVRPVLGRVVAAISGCVMLFCVDMRLFPTSGHAVVLHFLSSDLWLVISAAIVAAICLHTLGTICGHLRSLAVARGVALAVAAFLCVGVFVAATIHEPLWANSRPSHAETRPGDRNSRGNVFVIGVDSLSGHVLEEAGSALPNMTRLLGSGVSFRHAYTPIGRTFPAWISLLSGRSPAEHGAVFNLRRLDRVERSDLLSHSLRAQGYRTVFALDERRFANIDESFGFDQIVGPKVGVLDFVIQRFNETPLSNLMLQTAAGRWLLPFSHQNVASAVNYDAEGFVDAVLDASMAPQPVFAAVHFETGHFPFRSRHVTHANHQGDGSSRSLPAAQLAALTVVDRQIGRLISALERQNLLREALVVLVSDHGEGLGVPEPATDRTGGALNLAADGHGSSVVSERQNRVVFGVVNFRDGHPVGPRYAREELVSLADVRKIVEHYVSTGSTLPDLDRQCMTVETGIRLASAETYRTLDEAAVAREAAGFYEIDDRGRMRIREDRLAPLLERKDVGLRCMDRITYWSSVEGRYIAYSIDPKGDRRVEIDPRPSDLVEIEKYRVALRRASDSSTSERHVATGSAWIDDGL